MDVTVSVIIPTHNRADLLRLALESVLAQSFQDFEVIVIDDASSDHTQPMLKALKSQDKRIHMITNSQPQGGAVSRNIGIAASRGEWIAFLDDDDTWLPQKLTRQLRALANHPDAAACSCGYTVNYPFKIKRKIKTAANVTYGQLLDANVLGGASVCICSAEIIKRIGGFDKKLRSSQDWDLWLRLREQGEIISIPDALVEYQVHFADRISNDMRAKYLGARRFYLKYKNQMDENARLMNLSFICFIQSRQSFRPLISRWKKLLMAVRYSTKRAGFTYLLSSLPRMIFSFKPQ